MEVGEIEPHTHVAAQGLTPYCDQIVTVFWAPQTAADLLESKSELVQCSEVGEEDVDLRDLPGLKRSVL